MKYIYGPVPSRRLGLSLGLDIIPSKYCTFSCIYCQIGKTPFKTLQRMEYVPPDEVIAELREVLDSGVKPDWLTFSGSGEPTLHSGIGKMIREIKSFTDIPVMVITNGTLLWDKKVRDEIVEADAVMPSLDSATEDTFTAVCRPQKTLSSGLVIEGLIQFRKEYKGKIWLEILFVKGLNDSESELNALKQAIENIKPDKIFLNTVVRPPAESDALPIDESRLKEIREFFGEKAEIVATLTKTAEKIERAGKNEIAAYLMRRPGSTNEIASALGMGEIAAESILNGMEGEGIVKSREHSGKKYWEYIFKKGCQQ